MQIKTDILTSSSVYTLSSSAYNLLPALGGGNYYEITKIICTLNNVTIPYNSIDDIEFFIPSVGPITYLFNSNLNSSTNSSFVINNSSTFSSSLSIQIPGQGPTAGDGTFQIDTYYDIGNINNTSPIITFGSPIAINSSIAEGYLTVASGDYSHAEGNQSLASGSYSHAEGSNTTAKGISSHAEGASTQAIGDYSHAEGIITTAYGNSSHAEGVSYIVDYNIVVFIDNSLTYLDLGFASNIVRAVDYGALTITIDGDYTGLVSYPFTPTTFYIENLSYSLQVNLNYYTPPIVTDVQYDSGTGWSTIYFDASLLDRYYQVDGTPLVASGSYSHAEGHATIARGVASHAEGQYSLASGSFSHAEGSNTQAIGDYSHAEGNNTIALGTYSHAEGDGTQAKANSSHAEGQSTIASGSHSHAEGYNTIALGEDSHAEGSNTTAIGVFSHAEGGNTQAIGNYSHAEGNNAIAFGDYSHAGGLYTIASGSNQTVYGQYNTRGNTTDLFIIGGGSGDANANRKDIFRVSTTAVSLNAISSITGSLTVSGSGITGSLFGTASWSQSSSRATTSSYALTSSYVTPYETAWTSYTPSWTTPGTQPSLGNGTLVGAYKQIGKTVFVRVNLIFGTTTTGGTGDWQFGLPVTASSAYGIQFPCSILDAGNAWYQATVNGQYSGFTYKTSIIGQSAGANNSSQGVTSTFPITWGASDSLQFNGSYEGA